MTDIEHKARELLAAEYERDGKAGAADHIRTQPLLPNKARAVRAIAAALRQQPAPVDLEQFREAVECWRDAALPANSVDAERVAEADRLLSIIDSAGSAVRPFNATKPAECAKECPPQQVCDYCQIASNAHQPAPVVDDAMVVIDGRRYSAETVRTALLGLAADLARALGVQRAAEQERERNCDAEAQSA